MTGRVGVSGFDGCRYRMNGGIPKAAIKRITKTIDPYSFVIATRCFMEIAKKPPASEAFIHGADERI